MDQTFILRDKNQSHLVIAFLKNNEILWETDEHDDYLIFNFNSTAEQMSELQKKMN
jgi:hypothetical protein